MPVVRSYVRVLRAEDFPEGPRRREREAVRPAVAVWHLLESSPPPLTVAPQATAALQSASAPVYQGKSYPYSRAAFHCAGQKHRTGFRVYSERQSEKLLFFRAVSPPQPFAASVHLGSASPSQQARFRLFVVNHHFVVFEAELHIPMPGPRLAIACKTTYPLANSQLLSTFLWSAGSFAILREKHGKSSASC